MTSNPLIALGDQKDLIPPDIAESAVLSQFEQESLDEHNRLRTRHGCPPLVLNRDLCIYALKRANDLASPTTLDPETKEEYGENIFKSTGHEVDGKLPAKTWYEGLSKYNFKKPGFTPETGHFTQVVWKDSQQLGVAIVTKENNVWVVAIYNPSGNILNEFVNNVPKPEK